MLADCGIVTMLLALILTVPLLSLVPLPAASATTMSTQIECPKRAPAPAPSAALDAARLASRRTLSIKIVECPPSEDLRYISAYQYHRLLDLHRTRAQAAQELVVYADEFKCMMCNGTHYGQFIPPKWWRDFQERAGKELSERPTTETIFSMAFLAESANAGCERCAGSILTAGWFLDQLKQAIDELPSTV